jgi:hypothetical protein
VIALHALLRVPSCRVWGYGGPAQRPWFWSFTGIDFHHGVGGRAGDRTGPGVAGGGT